MMLPMIPDREFDIVTREYNVTYVSPIVALPHNASALILNLRFIFICLLLHRFPYMQHFISNTLLTVPDFVSLFLYLLTHFSLLSHI